MNEQGTLELIDLLEVGREEQLHNMIAQYQPYDLADMLGQLEDDDRLRLIAAFSIPMAAEVLEYVEPELQYWVLDQLREETTALILNEMSSDMVADLFLAIHPHQAETLMDYLSPDYREKISNLMNFSPGSAGSLVTIDYISVRSTWKVEHTLRHIRKVGREAEIVSYIYIVDQRGKLSGVISLKELILADPSVRLEEILREDVISVPAQMDQQEVANLLTRYDLVAIPVVTFDNRMIGIITVDDLIDVIHEEATEDIQKMGASQPLVEPYFKNSVWGVFRKRIGWLLILFVAEAYTGNVLRHYEETLSEVIALAFFIPLLLGTGGNSGTQTVTTLVRAMALGEVRFNDIFRVMGKELATGLLLGVSMGTVALVRAEFLGVGINIGLVVAISALFVVIWASIVSAALPLILHKLRVDPAVVSGPFIATLVDGTGLVIYFTMAKVMLNL